MDVPTQRQMLRTMPEAFLERVEPPHQAVELANGAAVVHCAAPYQKQKYNVLKSDHSRDLIQIVRSDKVVLGCPVP